MHTITSSLREVTLWRPGRALLLYALLSVRFTSLGCGRQDEYLCEEAARHIDECCGKKGTYNCQFKEVTQNGCNARFHRTDYPDLSPSSTAQCLIDTDCDTLKRTGACALSQWGPVYELTSESHGATIGGNPINTYVNETTVDCTKSIPTRDAACAVLRVLQCQ